jgi:Protein of unknown function (DUF3386)
MFLTSNLLKKGQASMRSFYLTALALAATYLVPTLAHSFSSPDDTTTPAKDLLERARDARATWDKTFPGFTADLTICMDGESVKGTVSVSPKGKIEVNAPEGKARDWATEQLRSEVMHRLAGPIVFNSGAEFAEPEGTHPLGRLIRLTGDRMESSYRIKGDQLLEVNRTMRGAKFSNKILATTRNAEGKYLPEAFSVTYWDAQSGALKKTETFYVTWTRIGRFDLPVSRTQVVSEGNTASVRRLELSHHKLSESGSGEAESAAAK